MNDLEFEQLMTNKQVETPSEMIDFYKEVLNAMEKDFLTTLSPYKLNCHDKNLRTKSANINYNKKEINIYDNMVHWRRSIIHEAVHQLIHNTMTNHGHYGTFWILDIHYCKMFRERSSAPRRYHTFYTVLNNIPFSGAISLAELKALLPHFEHETVVRQINSNFMRKLIMVKFDNDDTAYFRRRDIQNMLLW